MRTIVAKRKVEREGLIAKLEAENRTAVKQHFHSWQGPFHVEEVDEEGRRERCEVVDKTSS